MSTWPSCLYRRWITMCSKHYLAGTVDHYVRQVFVGTEMKDWPNKVENASFDQLNGSSLIQVWKQQLPDTVKLHACNAKKNSVFIFPEAIYYDHVSLTETPSLDTLLLVTMSPSTSHSSRLSLPRDHYYFFVCTHKTRDPRCGQRGPAIVAAIRQRAIEKVHVFECSHVGGHKYAGNVIVYGLRHDPAAVAAACGSENLLYSGDWYGLVEEKDVEMLLQYCVIQKTVWKKKWRGAIGVSMDQQKQMAINWGLTKELPCQLCDHHEQQQDMTDRRC
jgi:hypothetical protein